MKNYVKDTLDTILKAKDFFQAVAYFILLFGTIVNLVIQYRLMPFTQNVQAIESKVLANETAIVDIGKDIEYIRDRVDDIYTLMIK